MSESKIPRRALLHMSLGAGLGALAASAALAADEGKTARVADANATVDLRRNDSYRVSCTRVPHTGGDVVRLGYRIESKYGVVAISGDTAASDVMVDLGKNADVMLHELTIPDFGMTTGGSFSSAAMHSQDQVGGKAAGHTSPTLLGELAAKAHVSMLVPYHLPPYGSVPAAVEMSSLYYGSDTDESIWAAFVAAIKKSYSGKVVLARDRMIMTLA